MAVLKVNASVDGASEAFHIFPVALLSLIALFLVNTHAHVYCRHILSLPLHCLTASLAKEGCNGQHSIVPQTTVCATVCQQMDFGILYTSRINESQYFNNFPN